MIKFRIINAPANVDSWSMVLYSGSNSYPITTTVGFADTLSFARPTGIYDVRFNGWPVSPGTDLLAGNYTQTSIKDLYGIHLNDGSSYVFNWTTNELTPAVPIPTGGMSAWVWGGLAAGVVLLGVLALRSKRY